MVMGIKIFCLKHLSYNSIKPYRIINRFLYNCNFMNSSDNGKNFIGDDEEAKPFREVFDVDQVQNELSTKGFEWIFNCPANPSKCDTWKRIVQCEFKKKTLTKNRRIIFGFS